ncbi:hypothetical protein BK816_08740 [Boudabousia tangfeifanii]|uniref:Uncharacterized protein n=1 Tax=Boudabousia tangfeifanii TaxID=1912795 RepID=A0A1D9MM37_9ACTO|nr:hypothetical protein [Boudabousia tangfeifanii]AOZ73345.1 hypothetical protein BK816_08740 [Boudabousia tangfeifanii]
MSQSNSKLYIKYLARRATHSSRAWTAGIVGFVVAVISGYLLVELVMSMLGYGPLLASPLQMLEFVRDLPSRVALPWLALVGLGLFILGLILLIKALAAGSLNRHQVDSDRVTWIIDDRVLAAAVSSHLRQFAGLGQGQVITSVDRKTVTVTVSPHAGRIVDKTALQNELVSFLSSQKLTTDLRPVVEVQTGGAPE